MESTSHNPLVKDEDDLARFVEASDKEEGGESPQTWYEISRDSMNNRMRMTLEQNMMHLGESDWPKMGEKSLDELKRDALLKEEMKKKRGEDPSSEEEKQESKGLLKRKSVDDSNTEETKTSDELEKTDTESDATAPPLDYVPDDGGVVTEDEVDSDKEEDQSQEERDRTFWRVNFRNRNRVKSDNLYVDATSPPPEPGSPNSLSQFEKGPDGETLATSFQFRHKLKESTYKNKYVIQLDGFKMTYSEREDSILIRNGDDATVHMGTSSNTEFRDRNMAMEQLREILALRIRVWKSLFVSNRSAQMGEMDMVKCVNMITADNLTVMMDSYANVVQIVNLHRPVLKKFTLICCDEFPELFDLEQIRLCPALKLDGPSNMSDDQLFTLKASQFEIQSDKITAEGINSYLKVRVSNALPARFHGSLYTNGDNWDIQVALKNLNFTEYESKEAYEKMNGSVIISMEYATMGYISTCKPDENLVIVIDKTRFRCFKEGQRTELLAHDNALFD